MHKISSEPYEYRQIVSKDTLEFSKRNKNEKELCSFTLSLTPLPFPLAPYLSTGTD